MKGNSYSQRLYRRAILKLSIVPVLLIIASSALLIYGVQNIFAVGIPAAGFVGFVVGAVFFPIGKRIGDIFESVIDPMYSKFEDPLLLEKDAAKRGMDGERTVFAWFDDLLAGDTSWTVLKNEEFKGSNGTNFDVDVIAIGPRGVFVFEIKNLSYDFFFTTEDCAIIVGDQIRKCTGEDPRAQVVKNAEMIEKLLKAHGVTNVRTKRAVIFARPESVRFLGSPAVFLIDNKNTLKKYLLETTEDSKLTPSLCAEVKMAILNK